MADILRYVHTRYLEVCSFQLSRYLGSFVLHRYAHSILLTPYCSLHPSLISALKISCLLPPPPLFHRSWSTVVIFSYQLHADLSDTSHQAKRNHVDLHSPGSVQCYWACTQLLQCQTAHSHYTPAVSKQTSFLLWSTLVPVGPLWSSRVSVPAHSHPCIPVCTNGIIHDPIHSRS